jgi:hypothetical protein
MSLDLIRKSLRGVARTVGVFWLSVVLSGLLVALVVAILAAAVAVIGACFLTLPAAVLLSLSGDLEAVISRRRSQGDADDDEDDYDDEDDDYDEDEDDAVDEVFDAVEGEDGRTTVTIHIKTDNESAARFREQIRQSPDFQLLETVPINRCGFKKCGTPDTTPPDAAPDSSAVQTPVETAESEK